MRIAIASGKGGAGKTTLTASLHRVWPRSHVLADTDVEAPNLHLFLHPQVEHTEVVSIVVPMAVEAAACTLCGKCRSICHFGAIARFGQKMTLFPDMCHACGGCFSVCGSNALVKGQRTLGTIELGHLADGTSYVSGTTRIGEVMTPPVLRRLLAELDTMAENSTDVLLDSPPGVSCPAVTVARNVNAVLLVVDPTPFGMADFRIAWEAFRTLGLPLAVIINRADMPGNTGGDAAVAAFCQDHALPLIGAVPFSREAAKWVAQGGLIADMGPQWHTLFARMANDILFTFGEMGHA
ncbi:MAG: (4Fe-4S)-binding protein [Desulfovibrio sp.]|nr:(4Fe-4S)-binding protein [Desulfovibrio sp.]